MSGSDFFIDTNIALYLLSGNKTVAHILHGASVKVSFITELELLGYRGITKQELQKVKSFLSECSIVDINHDIKQLRIGLRQKSSLRLPDCIIAASALYLDLPFLTADTDFKRVEGLSLLLFEEK